MIIIYHAHRLLGKSALQPMRNFQHQKVHHWYGDLIST
jgi:hypothetical protein